MFFFLAHHSYLTTTSHAYQHKLDPFPFVFLSLVFSERLYPLAKSPVWLIFVGHFLCEFLGGEKEEEKKRRREAAEKEETRGLPFYVEDLPLLVIP